MTPTPQQIMLPYCLGIVTASVASAFGWYAGLVFAFCVAFGYLLYFDEDRRRQV